MRNAAQRKVNGFISFGKGTVLGAATLLLIMSMRQNSLAFNQPPLNLSATTFLDGGGAPPGFFLMEYVQFINGEKAVDNNGRSIPGGGRVNVLVSLHQFYYLSPLKLWGANVGLDVLAPVSATTVRGNLGPIPISANTAGLGDVAIGPALQWNDTKIKGIPIFQRWEMYTVLPSGKYAKSFIVNPGSNIHTYETYYAFTTFLSPRIETSWRIQYAFHSENKETQIKPGQVLHVNYAFSYGLTQKWRLGAAGYVLQQLNDDELNGFKIAGSKEKGYAAGPGLVYLGGAASIMCSHVTEFGGRNRFQGSRTTLQIINRF